MTSSNTSLEPTALVARDSAIAGSSWFHRGSALGRYTRFQSKIFRSSREHISL